MLGQNAGAAPLAHGPAFGRVFEQAGQGGGKGVWIAGGHQQAIDTIEHHGIEVAHTGGYHRQFGGQILVDLERREIEVLLLRVGGGGNVHARQQGRHLAGLHGAGELAVTQQSLGGEGRFHVDALRTITHHQQPCAGVLAVQAGKGVHQHRQAMPGLERAQKADDGFVLAGSGLCVAGLTPGRAVVVRGRIHAIGHHVHASARAGPGVQIIGHARRDGHQGTGPREGRRGHGLCLGFEHQPAVGALFLDQRGIDLQHAGNVLDARPAHAHVTPERIALVDEVEGAMLIEQRRNAGMGPQGGVGTLFWIALRQLGQLHAGCALQPRGYRAIETGGKQGDTVTGLQGRAHDRLHVNRGTLGAEDGNAGVGAEIGDMFHERSGLDRG